MSEADKYSNHKMVKITASNYMGEGINPLIVEVARQGELSSPDNIGLESLHLLRPVWARLEVRQN